MREAATIYPAPCKLTFDLLTLIIIIKIIKIMWQRYQNEPSQRLQIIPS